MYQENSTNSMSIFIPYVLNEHNEKSIKDIFYHYGIGEIERVDFFVKEGWTLPNKKSAFVHMRHWYYSDNTNNIYNELEKEDGKWNLTISEYEYWTLKRMKRNKLEKTDYNIHQLAEQVKNLQREVEQLRMILSGPLEVLDENVDDYIKEVQTRTHKHWIYETNSF
jgi:hypothetical protein